jgi:hypothetical protein
MYREATSVAQEVHKVFNDIENLTGCTPAKVGKSYSMDLYCE